MTSKRNETQLYIEKKVGCTEVDKWLSYNHKVNDLVLNHSDEVELSSLIIKDAQSYYQKSLISFCEAIHGIKKQRYTWSIVKLYYSTFYSIRADILLSGYFLIRCGALFYGRAKEGTKITKYQIRNVRGDHQYTTHFSAKLHKDKIRIDLVQDMLIEDIIPYFWLMKQRERVNYQSREFLDPSIDEVLAEPVEYIKTVGEEKLFALYDSDEYQLYCGSEQHACVAIPYNKLRMLQKEFSNKNSELEISEALRDHLNQLVILDNIHAS
jgi:hypothetical protein